MSEKPSPQLDAPEYGDYMTARLGSEFITVKESDAIRRQQEEDAAAKNRLEAREAQRASAESTEFTAEDEGLLLELQQELINEITTNPTKENAERLLLVATALEKLSGEKAEDEAVEAPEPEPVAADAEITADATPSQEMSAPETAEEATAPMDKATEVEKQPENQFKPGQTVKHRRSSGRVEDGWTVESVAVDEDQTVKVYKIVPADDGQSKKIYSELPTAELAKVQSEEAATVYKAEQPAESKQRAAERDKGQEEDDPKTRKRLAKFGKAIVGGVKQVVDAGEGDDRYGFKRQAYKNQLSMYNIKTKKREIHIPLTGEARAQSALGSKDDFDTFVDAVKENGEKHEIPGYKEELQKIIDARAALKDRLSKQITSIKKGNGVVDRGKKATNEELNQIRKDAIDLHRQEDALRRKVAAAAEE